MMLYLNFFVPLLIGATRQFVLLLYINPKLFNIIVPAPSYRDGAGTGAEKKRYLKLKIVFELAN